MKNIYTVVWFFNQTDLNPKITVTPAKTERAAVSRFRQKYINKNIVIHSVHKANK